MKKIVKKKISNQTKDAYCHFIIYAYFNNYKNVCQKILAIFKLQIYT